MKYIYSFTVWPDETWKHSSSVYKLFKMLTQRVEMEMVAEEFEKFRSDVSHFGITLREIERVPYVTPETVH